MRCSSSFLAVVIAAAACPGTALAAPPTGGVEYDTEVPLRIRSFQPSVRTVALRVDGPAGRVRLQVDVLDAASRAVVERVRLGSGRTGRAVRIRWTPELAPGAYLTRLQVTASDGRRARRAGRKPLRIATPAPTPAATPAPTPTAPATLFPVQGAFTFGEGFGAARPGHAHQGQDLLAAEGTPIVSPAAGVVHWRAYQGSGAGHYLVIRSPGLGDHAYMHLREGSIAVDRGDAVAAGRRIAEVGSTGRSSAPHLHFELWPGGWWENGSKPVDPRAQLDAWAAGRG